MRTLECKLRLTYIIHHFWPILFVHHCLTHQESRIIRALHAIRWKKHFQVDKRPLLPFAWCTQLSTNISLYAGQRNCGVFCICILSFLSFFWKMNLFLVVTKSKADMTSLTGHCTCDRLEWRFSHKLNKIENSGLVLIGYFILNILQTLFNNENCPLYWSVTQHLKLNWWHKKRTNSRTFSDQIQQTGFYSSSVWRLHMWMYGLCVEVNNNTDPSFWA